MARYLFLDHRNHPRSHDNLRDARKDAKAALEEALKSAEQGESIEIEILRVKTASKLQGTVVQSVAVSEITDESSEDNDE